MLALFSKVMADMFTADPDQSRWSKGIAAAWEGSTPETVELYLKATYWKVGSKDQEGPLPKMCTVSKILKTLEMAHKLDNEVVKKVRCFESLFFSNEGRFIS